jgi:hypothetical protein
MRHFQQLNLSSGYIYPFQRADQAHEWKVVLALHISSHDSPVDLNMKQKLM